MRKSSKNKQTYQQIDPFPRKFKHDIKTLFTGIIANVVQVVEKKGYKYYDWNVSSNDATGRSVNPARIIESSQSQDYHVSVFAMHDTATKTTTVQALPAIIEYYR